MRHDHEDDPGTIQDLSGLATSLVESRLFADGKGIRVQMSISSIPSTKGKRGFDVYVDDASMARFIAAIFDRAAFRLNAVSEEGKGTGWTR